MLNTNPGGLDPSNARPGFGFGAPPQNQGTYLTGGLQFNATFNNIQNVQNVLAARNGLVGHGVAAPGQAPPVQARLPPGTAGGPLGQAQFAPVGRSPLPGMQVNVGPVNGLINNPAVNRAPSIVPQLALNPGMAGAVRPSGMERGGITPALNMGIQNAALQQRGQATANFGLARPVNALGLAAGGPIGPQLGVQIPGGFGMGTNPPARGNPLTMHPGFPTGNDGLLQQLKAPGNPQLDGLGPGGYGLHPQQQQGPSLGQLGMQLGTDQQAQGGMPNGDGGLLPGLGNAELFANMHKAGGHQTEFSIQNEQEFPALPTTTQPRDDQLANQELQQSLQGGQQPHMLGRQIPGMHNMANGVLPARPGYGGDVGQPAMQGLRPPPQDPTNPIFQFQQMPGVRLPFSPQQQRNDRLKGQEMSDIGDHGMLGLLNVINMHNHDLTTLALGTDLTALGLHLNSNEKVWKTFGDPWADQPITPDPEFKVPACYLHKTIPRLLPGQFQKFNNETLFYIFYSMPGDEAQVFAADELFYRGWTFHKEFKYWLSRIEGVDPLEKRANVCERGSYNFFNTSSWMVERKDNFVLHYDALEKEPRFPRRAPALPPGQQAPPPQHPSG